jgi:ribosomal protein L37E
MALIKCPECGKGISDKAESCPNCGLPMTEGIRAEALKQKEKDAEEKAETEGYNKSLEEKERRIKVAEAIRKSEAENIKRKRLIVAVGVILIVLFGFYANSNLLIGRNKTAYDLLEGGAKSFKDPSSVRIISGTVSDDGKSMQAEISAKNGFGGNTTGDYIFNFSSASTSVYVEENGSILKSYRDNFNINKVNRIYSKKVN